MLIQVDGVSRPILMTGCDTLLPVLATVLGSWGFRPTTSGHADPVISVRRTKRRFRIDSPWLEEPAKDDTDVGTACCLTIDLVQAYVENNPSMLCLHCAAVDIDGRLVVFPSTVRAGKSTLIAQLASMGHRIYADDMLPIVASENKAMALGIAPRLRRPLPANAGAGLRAFVDAHRGPADRRYLYLSLSAASLAPHGSTAPLGALVLLDRRPSVRATLVPTPRGRGLRQLIGQNLVQHGGLIGSVERLAAVVERIPCLTLVYSDLDEAAMLIQERFGGWTMDMAPAQSAITPTGDSRPARQTLESINRRQMSTAARAQRFMQAPDVYLKGVGDDLFLVRREQDGAFHLNPTAATLWRLLARPMTIEEAVDVFNDAFPDTDRRQIKRDVHNLFSVLRSARLIQGGRVASALGRVAAAKA